MFRDLILQPARRRALRLTGALVLLAGIAACAPYAQPGATGRSPIVFVHGNGDTAALWQTTIWRFESNGWPRDRLHAIDVPLPLSRDEDDKPQAGRTSSTENMQFLAGEVDKVLARTGAAEVILVGNSRGGLAIRNYVRNGGGAVKVSHAILGGAPNHGVWADAGFRVGSEFNGAGPFLSALNAPQGPNGEEVTPGVKWLTLRSDHNDKFAQPEGRWIGRPGVPTNVTAEGPALKGAENVVLPGLDHREVSFHARAFGETWRFLTGSAPGNTAIVPESQVTLDGRISALAGAVPTNTPLAGARLEVYEVAAATGERLGAPVHAVTVDAGGRWGPFRSRSGAVYEFVVAAEGYATTHVYRSPFPRSSDIVNFRPARLSDADKAAGSVVILNRPRGYYDLRRDRMSLDGKPLPGITGGVAGTSAAKLLLPAGPVRTVVGEFNGERIAVRSWPAAENRVVYAELQD